MRLLEESVPGPAGSRADDPGGTAREARGVGEYSQAGAGRARSHSRPRGARKGVGEGPRRSTRLNGRNGPGRLRKFNTRRAKRTSQDAAAPGYARFRGLQG